MTQTRDRERERGEREGEREEEREKAQSGKINYLNVTVVIIKIRDSERRLFNAANRLVLETENAKA